MSRKYLKTRLSGLISAAVLIVGAGGCGIIPEEESYPAAPYFVNEEPADYKTAVCLRGDVILTTVLDLRTMPKQKVNLSVDVSDEHFDSFFVSTGDTVTEGQLLGQLDIKRYEDELQNLELSVSEAQLYLKQNEENRALAEKRCRLIYADSYENRQNELLRIKNQYDEKARELQDQLTIDNLRIEECKEEIAKRQLIAPFDGVMTYVATVTPDSLSGAGRRLMTVADSSTTLFRASTPEWEYFKPGIEIPLTVDDAEYTGTVQTEETLGIEETRHVEGSSGYVYVVLDSPAFDVTESQMIRVEVELERREGCLMVPAGAITKINDKSVVYVPDEEGVKRYREVEIGLKSRNSVEILSGLSEGETVIIN